MTGASGFIGAHVVRELRERGAEVRDDWIDLEDRARLRTAIAGCDAVFHLAALYSYDAPVVEHERVNVRGTRTVIELCLELGVKRLVHTSTCGTCGPVPGRAATEGDGPPSWELAVPYKRTKLEAERIVLAAARDGLDAVVVNPTTPVGEGDCAPTPTGRMIEGVATGRYRAIRRHGRQPRRRPRRRAWPRPRPGAREEWRALPARRCRSDARGGVRRRRRACRAIASTASRSLPSRAGGRQARLREPRRGAARPPADVLLVGQGVTRARLRAGARLAGSRKSCRRGAQWCRWPSHLKNWPIAITAMKIRPTTSIERTMSRPSWATSLAARSAAITLRL